MQILQLLLAGTVGAALVKLVDNVIQFLLNRAAKKSDRRLIRQTQTKPRIAI